ncbi:MAG: dihydropteroate synthase [candidate division WOR-3 bacterium]|nr:dihydropteroate synthase [candidate division WOR-3 bacterium]MCX7837476.1 dihydropteroate synthase [candidate division WOR-3 bacterium]MDW8114221.1 dihydropteroate synthase [candidate division WOR-3 bacterium]
MRILSLNDNDLRKELLKIGVDEEAVPIFLKKSKVIVLKLESLSQAACNILKQVALTCDSDCAIHKKVISGRKKKADAILITNLRGLEKICDKLNYQPEFLKSLKEKLEDFLKSYFKKDNFILKFKEKTYNLKERPLIMGILNLTPDSFYDGGKFKDIKEAVDYGIKMVEDGADIIDVGGESTRPGSEPVPLKEELKRVLPVIKELKKKINIPISIDTYKSEVAKICLSEGCEIVNDISGLRFDKKMAEVVANYDAYCVIMHIKGKPKTMQKRVYYKDVIKEIFDYLKERVEYAINNGIKREKIIIDPGIGFGKLLEHNLEIIRRLDEFKSLNLPILVGHSRKSFIGKILNCEPKDRLFGSISCAIFLALKGANILRVHDVKETKEAIMVYKAIINNV